MECPPAPAVGHTGIQSYKVEWERRNLSLSTELGIRSSSARRETLGMYRERRRLAVVVAMAVVLGASLAAPDLAVAQAKGREHSFTGTVESVDTAGKRVSVANDNVPGWMAPM